LVLKVENLSRGLILGFAGWLEGGGMSIRIGLVRILSPGEEKCYFFCISLNFNALIRLIYGYLINQVNYFY
jgi:hypothetical protein